MFKVTVRDGVSHKHVAVNAASTADAEAAVKAAGLILSGAESYPIDAYAVRFCDVVL